VLSDDHPFVLMGLKLVFDTEGFTVAEACESGERTLDAVREHRPDVLILDLQMPRMDGYAVLRGLRAEQSPTRTVSIASSRSCRSKPFARSPLPLFSASASLPPDAGRRWRCG